MRINKIKRGVSVAAAVVTLGWGTAQAEAPAFSGYVDLGYNYNFNGMGDNTNRAFDGQANTFKLQAAELDAQGKVSGDVTYRVDLQFGHDASVISTLDGSADEQMNIQQAFISMPCPWTGGLVTVGKFVTPFGAEVIESKDNYNQSRGLLFSWAIPAVHTGVKYDKGFMDGKWTVTAGVANGWDINDDNNKGKSGFVQTSLGMLPKTSIIIGGMYGPEAASPAYTGGLGTTEADGRGLVDVIVKVTPTDKLTLLANADWGVEEGAGFEASGSDDTTANWSGIAAYANYMFSDTWSGAFRYENFDDEGSRITGGSESNILQSYTFTLQKKIGDVLARLEYRTDMSQDEVYVDKDGMPDDVESTLGVSLTLPF